jgi:hypothetical protein
MELFKQEFEEVKGSSDPEIINDFLIKISKSPNEEHLDYLRYLIENLNTQILEKVILNLVFALGEIGGITSIEDYYQNFAYETYNHSDRWVRNEIIQAIEKISKNSKLNENVVQLIGNALNDDYQPIKLNTLKVLRNLEALPDFVFKNFFQVLNSKDSEVLEECNRVLQKFRLYLYGLFGILNRFNNYKILKPRAIRSLLLIQFKSMIDVESFRELIVNSNWDEVFKVNYLKEIDTFQRIMAKNL